MKITVNDFDIKSKYEKYVDSFYGKSYQNSESPCWCYIFKNKSTSLYKIGITSNLYNRRRQIKNASGCKILIVNAIQMEFGYDPPASHLEEFLHKYFKNKRGIGEWFELNIEDLVLINQIFWHCEGQDIKVFEFEKYMNDRNINTYGNQDFAIEINKI